MSTWVKASKCNGTSDCVEVRVWQTSSRCDAGTCVEVADLEKPVIQMRDSKDPEGLVLTFNPEDWRGFITDIKDGDFDL